MGSDHTRAPLLASLKEFVERNQAPFYSPGHKGGRTLDPWLRANIAAVDLNNLPDTDTLHCPEGPILEAERLIADAWGVPHSFVMVQGSTGGNIAVALTALRPDEPVLVARNAHKSVLAGLVQVGARPVWLEPRWDADFGVAHGLDADVVERAFQTTGATALWVLHPTYFGTTGDIAALAELCRHHDARLLVDGAHSPHFAFHPDLPTPGEQSGAAATVQSVHKILSGLSQAAVLHVDTDQLDEASWRRSLQLIQTTSPHFAIMASIDAARRQMALGGRELLEEALIRARTAADRLTRIPGLTVLRPEHLAGPRTGLCQLDETKLLIGTAGLNADAREILARLNHIHGVQPELAGTGHILCISTIGNTARDFDRLATAFEEVATHFGRRDAERAAGWTADVLAVRPDVVVTPRDAFFAATDTVALADATGRIAAEAITPYPPGIPLVMPGERLGRDVIDLLVALRRAGNPISASDPTLSVVTVVR
ncbi:aminotransferase class I/II-fold pyridoxal phosphate-dependent enzyme [Mycolicibacterium rufum]|uniref:Aminotransferase class I/II-fold pyridoxal phosphate-dependent enzyme n=1 Tax=Mycolicibacterium rufum TaxID=318424 RepID=A0A9X2Y8Z7_9MYCO|nr:aminotransferase class I/II-fold pyridoxal phosphate-dependent enzyme [Mycolicibacterium rufum]KGI68503.1 decarboxylase [Mycolicibacterium rufum]MCV7069502.1 aminotransferase class I/II-fold pyridoxal phosphate-dependent enzyme [Mycolicibacterium rufum]ULP34623.1 aminotransferase class I/II-fold pyridoxal phosphate-dependent enzyme [Mycolicibacterium rufum]